VNKRHLELATSNETNNVELIKGYNLNRLPKGAKEAGYNNMMRFITSEWDKGE